MATPRGQQMNHQFLVTQSKILTLSPSPRPPCPPGPQFPNIFSSSPGISQEYPKILNGTNGTSGFLPGGYTCRPHSQPWQAALLVQKRLLCGGVLVDPKWVLTAAHCLKEGYRVYLGKHALGRVEAGEQVREVVRSIPHPQYQISPTHLKHDHDIMLLELHSPVQLTNHIRVVPLSQDCLPAGTCCRVSGWGTTTSPQVSYPPTLQCANIQLRSDEECHQVYPGKITPNMLCAGTEEGGKDSCEGDSGGPLICNGTLHGIISWGDFPCGQPNRPGVYTRVSQYVVWIQETIQKHRTQEWKRTKGKGPQ
ncbi:kallikrein-13 isoform X1 [Prionailurus bengalensis]|uniref:kallikrein-13 isoform X1 n=1 Tax=Prionailurus bengalensis TaxID=37029 RepID=UPI001CAA23BB|nr:kallikrein-13 isoform X1 [Prionailurus bengalensis]